VAGRHALAILLQISWAVQTKDVGQFKFSFWLRLFLPRSRRGRW
jgi:hypothetical protein